MKHHLLYSTILAGALGMSMLGLSYNSAQALDLSDLTGADQRVITQEAPRAGGAVLVKENLVYPASQQEANIRARNTQRADLNTQPRSYGNSTATLNAVAPAGGGDGSTGTPGVGIDNKLDVTTVPGNSFDQSIARFNTPGTASDPVDGKPEMTDTLADGRRVEDSLNAVAPASGNAPTGGKVIKSSASSKDSVEAMIKGEADTGLFNN